MGASESKILPPWVPYEGRAYPPPVTKLIQRLSEFPETFLDGNADFFDGFDMAAQETRMQGALQYDYRIAQWMPKLVPKKLSEHDFWRNYFSHVNAILNQYKLNGVAADALPKSADVPSTGSTPLQPPLPAPQQLAPQTNGAHSMPIKSPQQTRMTAPQPPTSADPIQLKSPAVNMAIAAPPPQFNGSSPPLRWCVVGCGKIANDVVPLLQTIPQSSVVNVTSHNAAHAQAFAVKHRITHSIPFDQLMDAVNTNDKSNHQLIDSIDAFYIATPIGTHADIAIALSAAHKPVLLERPFGRSIDECALVLDAFIGAQTPIFIHSPLREQPRTAQCQLAIGNIGTIHSVTYHYAASARTDGWRGNAEQAGGGPLLERATDFFDLCEFLFNGIVTHVAGDAVHVPFNGFVDPVETVAVCTFRIDRNFTAPTTPTTNAVSSTIVGNAEWSFVSPISVDRLTVSGSAGIVTFSLYGNDQPVVTNVNGQQHIIPAPNSATNAAQSPYKPALTNVSQAMRTHLQKSRGGHELAHQHIAAGAGPAMRAVQCVDAILRAFYRSRADEYWRRPYSWQSLQRNVLQHTTSGNIAIATITMNNTNASTSIAPRRAV